MVFEPASMLRGKFSFDDHGDYVDGVNTTHLFSEIKEGDYIVISIMKGKHEAKGSPTDVGSGATLDG